MGKIWLVVTIIAGLVAAPFIAEGISVVIGDDGPTWFPYMIVVVLSAVALIAGDLTRGLSWGLLVGIVTVAAMLAWGPDGFRDFLNVELPAPF